MPGVIRKISYFGGHYEIIVKTEAAGELMVTTNPGVRCKGVGNQTWIGWSKDSGVPFPGGPVEMDNAYFD
jgi:hypothetical protein